MQINNLQIVPTGVTPVVYVSQYDVGRQFQFYLYDGSMAYNMPSGTTARIDGIKPDRHGFSYTDKVTVNGNVATVTTTEQMTVIEGTVECEIRFIKSGFDIGTLNFKMIVEKSPINEDTDISETEIPAIIELAREQLRLAELAAQAAAQSEANAKDSEDAAALSETNSANNAILSESWAKGGTGTRTGEDTNNSKYWSEQSEDSADAAAMSETNASASEQAAKLSEQKAKASEKILEYYVDFVIPRFIIANNRLYISDAATGEFIVANNRLYIRNAS